jgi:peptide-methionine (R)-S-oxide reductase
MTRRELLRGASILLLTPWASLLGSACHAGDPATAAGPPAEGGERIEPLDVPHAAWRRLLPSDAYAVLFEEDTEHPFTSPLNGEKRHGVFLCAACFLPLFPSDTKYDSGTGWPSFFRPLPGHIGTRRDFALVVPRTEYHCIRCGGHQGHVFDDGPKPTGLRYCNNGLALRFVPEGEPVPPLRRPDA